MCQAVPRHALYPVLRACVLLLGAALMPSTTLADSLVYFGTYTKGTSSEGIYVATLSDDGVLGTPKLAAALEQPSFVTISPDRPHLYSVMEVDVMKTDEFEAHGTGGVASFAINDDGTLSLLNTRPTGGPGACYVSITPDGSTVMVANYSGGSVASFPVGDDGSLEPRASFHQHEGGSGVFRNRQNAPHAHCIVPSADNRFAFVCDLGLDAIKVYRLERSSLQPTDLDVQTSPGGGPRHFAFSPDATRAFANLELGNQLVAMSYEAESGRLTIEDTESTLPDDHTGGGTAECLVHPDGRHVYVTNRGHDSIAVFDIANASASPTSPSRTTLSRTQIAPAAGAIPRGFGLTPDGRFAIVCHQNSGTVQVFAVEADGSLSPHGEPVALEKAVNARVLVRD